VKSNLKPGISDEPCRLPAFFHINIFERVLAEIDFRIEFIPDYVSLMLWPKMIRDMHLNLADNFLHAEILLILEIVFVYHGKNIFTTGK